MIAQLVQADEATVRDVIHRFNEIGLACLDPRWAGDRPRLLSSDDEDFVLKTATPHPAKLGQPLTRWSLCKLVNIRRWAKKDKVELCFTPTYASWAPDRGALRTTGQFAIANSNHPNHTVQTRTLHAYLRWRNANARHRDVLAAERKTAPASAARRHPLGRTPPHGGSLTKTLQEIRPPAPCAVR